MNNKPKKTHCPTCGMPVKVVGKTTLHYEPDLLSEEEIFRIITNYIPKNYFELLNMNKEELNRFDRLAKAISKRIRGEV